MVVPHGDPAYAGLRPGIGIPPLDGRMARSISMVSSACIRRSNPSISTGRRNGSPRSTPSARMTPTRSHFDAQDHMETGTPGEQADIRWLARTHAPGV